jgi:hypothetical protein
MSLPCQPYTAVQGENSFESVAICMNKYLSLASIVHLPLLKLRLLIDLQSLQRFRKEATGHKPQEMVDEIWRTMISSAVTKTLIECDDRTLDIESLTPEVKNIVDCGEILECAFLAGRTQLSRSSRRRSKLVVSLQCPICFHIFVSRRVLLLAVYPCWRTRCLKMEY